MLRPYAHADNNDAAWLLAGLLRERGDVEDLRRWADTGEAAAASHVAWLLRDRGNVDSAIAMTPPKAEVGDRYAVLVLEGLLRRRREHNEVAAPARQSESDEVKGYPSISYADPRRAHEIKPTNPATQARVWYAQAVLKAMMTRDEKEDAIVNVQIRRTLAGDIASVCARSQQANTSPLRSIPTAAMTVSAPWRSNSPSLGQVVVSVAMTAPVRDVGRPPAWSP